MIRSLARYASPRKAYSALLAGELKADAGQAQTVQRLQALYEDYTSGKQARGLYLHGSVGAGKTMLMDLFYDSIAGREVKRVHFHEFMYDIHRKMHSLKGQGQQPIRGIADGLADTKVLCFDEFAVTSIQDAVLLAPLFQELFDRGMLLVATSNREPEALYENGLNRHIYLPQFIKTMRDNCEIFKIDTMDYRRMQAQSEQKVLFWGADANERLEEWWAAQGDSLGSSLSVGGYGRQIPVTDHQPGMCKFDFHDLFTQPTSAEDYHGILSDFHTVVITGIPKFSKFDHNAARRFTNFVDVVYEKNVRLVGAFDVNPESIFDARGTQSLAEEAPGAGELRQEVVAKEMHVFMPQMDLTQPDMEIWHDGLPKVSRSWDNRRRASQFMWEAADPTAEEHTFKGVKISAIASLAESGFAMARAQSRLCEMQTQNYLSRHAQRFLAI